MSRSAAKAKYSRQAGEGDTGYISAFDAMDSIDIVYDDLESAIINVKNYGAVGDNVSDDTVAIQNAINASPEGSEIYFPPGTYKISSPIVPRDRQILRGTNTCKYDPDEFPEASCMLKASSTFTGEAVVRASQGITGVRLESLALIGPGTSYASVVHGVSFGTFAARIGERGWVFRDVSISACSGAGLFGHMWVVDMRDSHISRCAYAIRVSGSDALLDARIIGCQFYFNRDGGILLDSATRSGAVSIAQTRVERSGNAYGDPAHPINDYAPGIKITNAMTIDLIGVTTDANTGPGLEIIGAPSGAVYSVLVVGCEFARDGGGNQSAGVRIPGVNIKNARHIQFVANNVTYGAHDDSNPSPLISPYYGVKLEETVQCSVVYSRLDVFTNPAVNGLLTVGSENFGNRYNLQVQGLMSLPVAGDSTFLPSAGGIGDIAYQADIGSVVARNYSGNWIRMIGYDGVNPPRFPPIVDLYGDGSTDSSMRFVVNDKVRAFIGVSGTSGDIRFDRFDDAEAYVDSPLVVRRNTGLIESNHHYITAPSASNVLITARGKEGQSASLLRLEDSTGEALMQVYWDGRVQAPDANDTNQLMTLGQFKSVVAAATSWEDFQADVANM